MPQHRAGPWTRPHLVAWKWDGICRTLLPCTNVGMWLAPERRELRRIQARERLFLHHGCTCNSTISPTHSPHLPLSTKRSGPARPLRRARSSVQYQRLWNVRRARIDAIGAKHRSHSPAQECRPHGVHAWAGLSTSYVSGCSTGWCGCRCPPAPSRTVGSSRATSPHGVCTSAPRSRPRRL